MTADSTRPLYPRTQFASGGQHGATPRVHVGDTSQPSSGIHCFQLFLMRVSCGSHIFFRYKFSTWQKFKHISQN